MALPYQFAPEFQVAIASRVLSDPAVLPRLARHVVAERFTDPEVRQVVAAALGYYARHERAPSAVEVLQELHAQAVAGRTTPERVQVCAAMLEVALEQPPAASGYVLEQVLAAERRSAVGAAIDAARDLFVAGDLDRVVEGFRRADRIGRADMSVGTDYLGGLDARTQDRIAGVVPPRWGTGIEQIDQAIRGGLSAGELGCVMAPSGAGKTMFLLQVAREMLRLGGVAVYYSLEMSEQDLVDRVDAAVSGVMLSRIREDAGDVKLRVLAWLRGTSACLVVKKLTAKATTVNDLRGHLVQLRAERSLSPSVVVVDYADKLGHPGRGEMKRHELLGEIYVDLRNMAEEFTCPVWTASQTNRGALEKEVVTAADIGESYDKVKEADTVVAICRTDDEKREEFVRFKLVKCRYEADGIPVIGPLKSNYAVAKIVADAP